METNRIREAVIDGVIDDVCNCVEYPCTRFATKGERQINIEVPSYPDTQQPSVLHSHWNAAVRSFKVKFEEQTTWTSLHYPIDDCEQIFAIDLRI